MSCVIVAWMLAVSPCAAAVLPGSSALIDTLDYSDEFTINTAARPGTSHYTGGNAVDAYYNIETAHHGLPTVQWRPTGNFSFNLGEGTTCCGYPGNSGNSAAALGLAQSGGGEFSIAYGLRNDFVVQADATFTSDRIDFNAFAAAGDQLRAANSLSIFFRRDGDPNPGIGLYNSSGTESGTGFTTGIAATDMSWHNFAVRFNNAGGSLSFYVDEVLKGTLDLNTFAGGLYKNYSTDAVGLGGVWVNWHDNFQVGLTKGATPPPTPVTLTWDGDPGSPGLQDGSGGWNTGDTNRWRKSDETYQAWPNHGAGTAVFGAGGTGSSTVTLEEDLAAAKLDFEAGDAYTITGRTITLGAGGITVNKAARIESVIAGANGLRVDGPATITLTAASTYAGATQLNGANLQLSGGDNRLPAGTPLTINDGVLDLGGATQNVGTLNVNAGEVRNGDIRFVGTVTIRNGTVSANLGNPGNNNVRVWIGGNEFGTVTLSGNNTHTFADGFSTIIGHSTTGAAGTVKLGSATALGPQTTDLYTGTLDLSGVVDLDAAGIRLQSPDISFLVNSSTTTAASTKSSLTVSLINNNSIGGAGDVTLNGPVVGPGKLTKIGNGKLTLTNAGNTFSGGTQIDAGTLQIGDGSTSNGSLPGNITNNATLIVANPSDATYGGVVSGTGNVIKSGAGVLTIGPNQAYSGPTTIAAGTLQLSPRPAAPPVSLSTDVLNQGNPAGAMYGDGYGNGGTVDLVRFIPNSDASPLDVTYTQAGATIDFADFVAAGATAGTLGSNMHGRGAVLFLPGDGEAPGNNYGGIGLGAHANWLITFDLTAVRTAFFGGQAVPLSLTGRFGMNGQGGVGEWVSPDGRVQGTIYYDGALAKETLLRSVADPSDPINLTVPSEVRYLTLAVVNGRDNGTFYDDGSFRDLGLNLLNPPVLTLQHLPLNSSVVLGSGATLDLNGNIESLASLSDKDAGGGKITNNGEGNAVLTLGSSGTPASTATTFSGVIQDHEVGAGTGTISLIVNSPNLTQTLSGANTYTGGTTVTAGTLQIASAAALPAGRSLAIGAGGTVVLSSGLSAASASSAAGAAPVPEPGTLALLAVATGLAALAGLRRRRVNSVR